MKAWNYPACPDLVIVMVVNSLHLLVLPSQLTVVIAPGELLCH